MSELLRIASALRRASDDDLKAVISQRMVNSSGLLDFFDLADSLSQPKSVASTVAGLPKPQIAALVAILDGKQPDDVAAERLQRMMLIDRNADGEYELFDSTAACLQSLALDNKPVDGDAVEEVAPSQAEVDRDAGIAAFESSQALTELVFDVEQRFIREVGKKNVGLPDNNRLAHHLIASAPNGMSHVYFVSGGSEAMEAAMKMARQYFVETGQPQRRHFIARRQSYHGNTLGALAVGGNAWRREQFKPDDFRLDRRTDTQALAQAVQAQELGVDPRLGHAPAQAAAFRAAALGGWAEDGLARLEVRDFDVFDDEVQVLRRHARERHVPREKLLQSGCDRRGCHALLS